MQHFTRLVSSSKSRFLGSVNSECNKYPTRNVFRAFVTSEMASDSEWRGVPLTEIWGSQSPWGAPEFPLVAPAFNHTVLYHIPSNGSLSGDRPPKPQSGHDKWDHDFVRMPCSSQSLYPVEDVSCTSSVAARWVIVALRSLTCGCIHQLTLLIIFTIYLLPHLLKTETISRSLFEYLGINDLVKKT